MREKETVGDILRQVVSLVHKAIRIAENKDLGGPDLLEPSVNTNKKYTVDELSLMNRRALVPLAAALGLDIKGRTPPDIRTSILEAQGTIKKGAGNLGNCELTGESNVPIEKVTIDGDEYEVGPRVLEALESGVPHDDILEGDF